MFYFHNSELKKAFI